MSYRDANIRRDFAGMGLELKVEGLHPAAELDLMLETLTLYATRFVEIRTKYGVKDPEDHIKALMLRVEGFEAENTDMRQCLRYVGESFAPGRGPRETAESVRALIRGLIGRAEELEGRHGVAPMAVACGLEPDATLDELYERMRSLVASEARVAALECLVEALELAHGHGPQDGEIVKCSESDQPEKEKPNGRD